MPSRRRLWAPLLATILAVALSGAACSSPDDTASNAEPTAASATPHAGGRLIVGLAADSDGFLPTINRWSSPTLFIARTVFDPLAAVDENGVTQPYLAKSFTANATFTEWRINLRPNIHFHDKQPLNAQAVVIHFDAAKRSSVTSKAIDDFSDVTAENDLTVLIRTTRPWAHLPDLLASQLGFLPSPRMYADDAKDPASNPVGTGPFVFRSWKQNDHLIVERNTDYWRTAPDGAKLPYLNQIDFRPVPSDEERSARLRSGDLDVVQTESYPELISFEREARANPDGRIRALIDTSEGTEANVAFNTQTGPFTDRNLRLAAAYAVDRKGLVRDMFDNYYEVANGPFTEASPWGHSDKMPTYFPERARQLIADWKRTHSNKAPKFTFSVSEVADNVPVAQRLAQAWKDVGFDVDLRSSEEKKFTVEMVTGTVDALLFRFWAKNDPDGLYHYLVGKNVVPKGEIGLNYSRYRSAVVDDALNVGRESTDLNVRKAAYQRLWDDLAENVPILWLYHTRWVIAYQSKVQGLGTITLPDGARAERISWGNLFLTTTWVDV
jgi:peptide/nickel transport system substrate-binding protein